MRDIALWCALLAVEDDPQPARLQALEEPLLQLAALPLRERFVFFAPCAALYEHAPAALRAAALQVLHGAAGFAGRRLLVRALDDRAPRVRSAAVEALRGAVESDAPRWLHALFARRPDVRQRAVALSSGLSSHVYALLLAADPDCRAPLRDHPPPDARGSFALRALEACERGWLPAPILRSVLLAHEGAAVQWLLGRTEPRPSIPIGVLLSDPTAQAVIDALQASPVTLLERVLAWFWQTGSEDTDSSDRFWPLLVELLLQAKRKGLRGTAALGVMLLAQRHGWDARAAAIPLLFDLKFLSWQHIPLAVRRAALTVLQRSDFSPSRSVTEGELLAWLQSELCLRDTSPPEYDLPAVGAVLHLSGRRAFSLVDKHLDREALARGFDRDPGAGLRWVRGVTSQPEQRSSLLRTVIAASHIPLAEILALAAEHERDALFELVAELEPAELLGLFQALLARERRTEAGLSLQQTHRLARQLGVRLADEHAAGFLRIWLHGKTDRRSRFGLEVLGCFAQSLRAEALGKLVARLSATRLRALLKCLPECPMFPHGSELFLAHSLREHRDPEVRGWAAGRLAPAADTPVTTSPPIVGVSALSRPELKAIKNAAPGQLARALAPCLRYPSRGLCSALASRSMPARPDIDVCLALLGCDDPLPEVARQFQRFGCDEGSFLSQLDQRAVATWQGRTKLPLHGHAWLHRWSCHLHQFGLRVGSEPSQLAGLLREAAALPSRVLAGQLWRSASSFCAQLRYHDKPRLRGLFMPEVLELCLEQLHGDLGVPAARCLLRFHQTATVEQRRHWAVHVLARLPECAPEVAIELSDWIDIRGLARIGPGRPALLRPSTQGRDRWQHSHDLDALRAAVASQDPEEAQAATLRLLELDEPGCLVLVALLEEAAQRPDAVPHAGLVAEALPLFPEGPALHRLERLAAVAEGELGFVLLLGSLELRGARSDGIRRLMQLACAATPRAWFGRGHWQRLLALGCSELELAMGLATSPHPRAYCNAVELLCAAEPQAAVEVALQAFLETDHQRLLALRRSVAETLLRGYGNPCGFPLLLAAALEADSPHNPLQHCDPRHAALAVGTVLLAGPGLASEPRLLELLRAPEVPAEHFDSQARRLVRELSREKPRWQAVRNLRAGHRSGRTPSKKLAETFAWGVRRGRELTGRLFQVSMASGKQLGYTRVGESQIHITPLPILKQEQWGEDVVRGLIVHELGHQLYHSDKTGMATWKKAEQEGLAQLLNLVADEHLERNLRALDREDGNRLKRLAAYAFQHLQSQPEIEGLLSTLALNSFAVLHRSRLDVAIERGCVCLRNGEVLRALAGDGSSFARFMRALRMGLGNRHKDPKVAQGLALFDRSFRRADMPQLLEVARTLQRIFGDETAVLQSFGFHKALEPSESELTVFGEGLTDGELQEQIERLLKRPSTPQADGQSGTGGLSLNVGKDVSFPQLPRTVPVPYDAAKAREYAAAVRRHARTMRRFLISLGLQLERTPRRLSGRSLDRAQLPRVLLHGDPRMMVARRQVQKADLFLGLLIDCSGSMQSGNNIHKARLFGSLLAEAARGLPGVDLRVFGFTGAELLDAGSAQRCAVSSLQAGGGNNDAGALWAMSRLALKSQRRGRLLVMISDGLPTDCSVAALKALVHRLSTREGICCAQVAVRPLNVVCFPHYVEMRGEAALSESVREFGRTVARLVRRTLR